MVSVPMSRSRFMRRAFLPDLASLITIVAFGLFFLLLLLGPWLLHARELAKRTTCAANMSGIRKGLHTYANDGAQGFPIAAHAKAVDVEKGKVKYAPGMIGKHRGEAGKPGVGETDDTATEISTTRNLWTLMRAGGPIQASFVCPSSKDRKNDEENPQDFWDFRNYQEVSYGYQVPYGKLGRPNPDGDQRCVLAADKGPYGAALEAGAKNPGVPTPLPNVSSEEWRPWNSPNHRRAGQNMLYIDAHVEWTDRPIGWMGFENIYTRWSDASGGTQEDPSVRSHGTPPTGMETPWSDTDALVYP